MPSNPTNLEIAERRLAFVRFMCNASQPSVADAYKYLKPRYPNLQEKALKADWNRRLEWMPTVLHLNDDTPAIEVLQSLRDIAKRAYNIYIINEFGKDANGNNVPIDHRIALEALRTSASAEKQAADFIADLKKVNVNFNQFNINSNGVQSPSRVIDVNAKSVTAEGTTGDSGIPIDEFEDTIRQAVDLQIAVSRVRQSLDTADAQAERPVYGQGVDDNSAIVSGA